MHKKMLRLPLQAKHEETLIFEMIMKMGRKIPLTRKMIYILMDANFVQGQVLL